jgi:hypothetical protein
VRNDLSSKNFKMAASPQPTTLKKEKKDESFLDKIGTLTRKKKVKEGSFERKIL